MNILHPQFSNLRCSFAVVMVLPGLVPIFAMTGGVNALAGVMNHDEKLDSNESDHRRPNSAYMKLHTELGRL